jgi:hypothetical protein
MFCILFVRRKSRSKWRGRENGEGEIQLDMDGTTNTGEITFSKDGKKLNGVLKSDYGNFKFSGVKVDDKPASSDTAMWDNCTASQHEYERVARWK